MKKCKYCNKEFSAISRVNVYCCTRCGEKAYNKKRRRSKPRVKKVKVKPLDSSCSTYKTHIEKKFYDGLPRIVSYNKNPYEIHNIIATLKKENRLEEISKKTGYPTYLIGKYPLTCTQYEKIRDCLDT